MLAHTFEKHELGDMDNVIYVLGRDRIVPGPKGRMSGIREEFFAFLSRNARNATDYFRLPPEHVVELGSHIDL